MNFRPYTTSDRARCKEIFFTNCPFFFHPDEVALLENWLNFQGMPDNTRVPAYGDSKKDFFFVLEEDGKIIGFAGFYLFKNENRAQLTWGAIDAAYHGKGYGKALFDYRFKRIKEIDADLKITLGTSQNTYKFFEKLGMKVTAITPNGYGYGFDKYEMMMQPHPNPPH